MTFGDLKTKAGQQALNTFLASRSYIEGVNASQADNVIFEALATAPSGDLFHAVRFFNHISSFSEVERKAFPGARKAVTAYGGAAPATGKVEEDEDDVDLFGSDEEEESEEKARIREERLATYAAKKAKKPTVAAKSMVKFDVKPWDDETDMVKMEELVKAIEMEGLVWGQFSLVPVAFGVKKLVAGCVIQDDLVSTQDLEDKITSFEDYVQSVDIAAFQKL